MGTWLQATGNRLNAQGSGRNAIYNGSMVEGDRELQLLHCRIIVIRNWDEDYKLQGVATVAMAAMGRRLQGIGINNENFPKISLYVIIHFPILKTQIRD
jgi:hypothetical protein